MPVVFVTYGNSRYISVNKMTGDASSNGQLSQACLRESGNDGRICQSKCGERQSVHNYADAPDMSGRVRQNVALLGPPVAVVTCRSLSYCWRSDSPRRLQLAVARSGDVSKEAVLNITSANDHLCMQLWIIIVRNLADTKPSIYLFIYLTDKT